ncbi:hypothetical protein JCM10914A_23710 [Paenibacillus sp. JCM 10914]|nr:muramoyltetrapeptide carboxypeptidase [Paenibacillus sp. JCM 10914]
MRYPVLQAGATIGITAPSSGVQTELHDLLERSIERMKLEGFNVICGETIWTQDKAKSAPARVRAAELNDMMRDAEISLVIPPWGGELLIEILEHLDFEYFQSKWLLGYSDLSVLLLAFTLKTGIATAHGTNLIELRGESSDATSAKWHAVLSTGAGESIIQYSSPEYQKAWDHDNPSPYVYHLTEPTYWRTVQDTRVELQGRLLGGCIDVIRHLIGTPFGDVQQFQQHHIHNEPILWYLENCELSTTDLRRSLRWCR